MNIKRLIIFLLAATCFLSGCRPRIDMQYLEKLARIKNPQYNGQPVPAETIEEIGVVVEKYRADLTRYAEAAENLGMMYKNLGLKYLDIGYYEQMIAAYQATLDTAPDRGEQHDLALALLLEQKELYAYAYAYFVKALNVSATEGLYYHAGLCAANIGKAAFIGNQPGAATWYSKAEKYYKQALALDPGYVEALYGLSILLVYELGRSSESIAYLNHIQEIQSKNTDALFVLGAAYVKMGRYADAIDAYATIEKITTLDSVRKQAMSNRERAQELYGGL